MVDPNRSPITDGLDEAASRPLRPGLLLGTAVGETATLALLLLNLAVLAHNDRLAAVIGPIHGALYFAGVLLTWTGRFTRTTKVVAMLPVVGAWIAVDRPRARRRSAGDPPRSAWRSRPAASPGSSSTRHDPDLLLSTPVGRDHATRIGSWWPCASRRGHPHLSQSRATHLPSCLVEIKALRSGPRFTCTRCRKRSLQGPPALDTRPGEDAPRGGPLVA